MTVTNQLKIIDNKIKTNQAQYDLDGLTAKISAYSFGDLKRYKYLTGEDLGYKPSVWTSRIWLFSIGQYFYQGIRQRWSRRSFFEEARKYLR